MQINKPDCAHPHTSDFAIAGMVLYTRCDDCGAIREVNKETWELMAAYFARKLNSLPAMTRVPMFIRGMSQDEIGIVLADVKLMTQGHLVYDKRDEDVAIIIISGGPHQQPPQRPHRPRRKPR